MSNLKTRVAVTPDFIIAGVFFAARNAWELLRDAHALYDRGSFASAYGLAVFCREELGKSKIWLEQWNRCLCGESVSLDDLRFGDANNHKKKLARIGKFLNEGRFSLGEPPEPGSTEEADLAGAIHQMNVRARLVDPDRTHGRRLDAFFVRPGGNEINKAYGQPRHQFDRTKSASQLLEADQAYDTVRRELLSLADNAPLPHTVQTVLPECPITEL